MSLSTATPRVLRLASMLAMEVQVSAAGSYMSTVLTRRLPLNPPTAYTRPLTTVTPHLQRLPGISDKWNHRSS